MRFFAAILVACSIILGAPDNAFGRPAEGELFAQIGWGYANPEGTLILQRTEDPIGNGLQLARLGSSTDSIDQLLLLSVLSDRQKVRDYASLFDLSLGYYVNSWFFLGGSISSASVVLENIRLSPPSPEVELLYASGFFNTDATSQQLIRDYLRVTDFASLRRGRTEFQRFNTLDFKFGVRFPNLKLKDFDPYINGSVGIGNYEGGATMAKLGLETGVRYYLENFYVYAELDLSQYFLTYPGSAVPGNGSPVLRAAGIQFGIGMGI